MCRRAPGTSLAKTYFETQAWGSMRTPFAQNPTLWEHMLETVQKRAAKVARMVKAPALKRQ